MATHSAPDLNTKPLPMGGYGNAATVYGSVTPTSGALASVYRPVRIPAGMTVTGLKINNDDLDTGGTAFAVKIGYTPVSATDGPAQNDTYFSPATTILSAAEPYRLAIRPNQVRERCVRGPYRYRGGRHIHQRRNHRHRDG